MEISVLKVAEEKTEKITIECHEVTQKVNSIVKYIKSLQGTITGVLEEQKHEIAISDIYYIESVDNRTYLYTKKNVYATDRRLYELEEVLGDAYFTRISKAVIVNLMKIKGISPAMNGRFTATLANGEAVIISRKYVADFKSKIKGGKQ